MIYRADTSAYNLTHFDNVDVNAPEGIKAQCYDNVIKYAKHYMSLGKHVRILLTYGCFGIDEAIWSYHYILQDVETKEFIDSQYNVFNFTILHTWTLDEYLKEHKKYKQIRKQGLTGEIFVHYAIENRKFLYHAGNLIKTLMVDSNKIVTQKHYLSEMARLAQYGYEPRYGKTQIQQLKRW